MNDKELIGKVHSAVYHQCQRRGYAAPVDVLMEIGFLPKQKYEDWRFGRVDYLERVCMVNLRKLSFIMCQMRVYAQKTGLKPSKTRLTQLFCHKLIRNHSVHNHCSHPLHYLALFYCLLQVLRHKQEYLLL